MDTGGGGGRVVGCRRGIWAGSFTRVHRCKTDARVDRPAEAVSGSKVEKQLSHVQKKKHAFSWTKLHWGH